MPSPPHLPPLWPSEFDWYGNYLIGHPFPAQESTHRFPEQRRRGAPEEEVVRRPVERDVGCPTELLGDPPRVRFGGPSIESGGDQQNRYVRLEGCTEFLPQIRDSQRPNEGVVADPPVHCVAE